MPEDRFRSVLFDRDVDRATPADPPDFFGDLNLDQVVSAAILRRDQYELAPFFHTPLDDAESIVYRHDVFRDLERAPVADAVRGFAETMRTMRSQLAQAEKRYYPRQQQRWFLDAVATYTGGIRAFARALPDAAPASRALQGLGAYLADYVSSPGFGRLADQASALLENLAGIRYALHITGTTIRVRHDENEPDYGAEVLRTFDKFRQAAPREYEFNFSSSADMNHVEAAVLDRVALLFPDVFGRLETFRAEQAGYLDETIRRFDREVQFYLAWLSVVAALRSSDLPFCYPEVGPSKEVAVRSAFDVALALSLAREKRAIVTNDLELRDGERILVVSGPNNGGKTTFARMVGQLHYLARLGVPVPASEARLFLCDRVFTHFEREEDIENLSGKLEDDLLRIRAILGDATADSLLIMNESFSSTTVEDALLISQNVVHQVEERAMLCVFVTFLYELASFGDATVSMVGEVDPHDPAVRTFRVVRRPAEGLAHAVAIAEKYGLTYERVRGRIGS